MNGQYSIKGYILQSLVALLDSFNQEWDTVCVEPNDESEKVDIRWELSNNQIVAIQVKSSKNPFSQSLIKKWAQELYDTTPNAYKRKLILVGNVSQPICENVNGVSIENKNLSIDDFQAIIMQKINAFFEECGKMPISLRLCKLFAKALDYQVLENSVTGKVISRDIFKNSLIENLEAIENHLKKSPYSLLLPDSPIEKEDIQTTIMSNMLSLFGWNSTTKNESCSIYNDRLGRDCVYSIDYWGDYECPLKDKGKDILYINAGITSRYANNFSNEVKEHLFSVDCIREKLIKGHRIDLENAYEYNIDFILSLAGDEQGKTLDNIASSYKNSLLNKNLIYCVVDNARADFLISSILTARKYMPESVVKFLYPITEDNSEHDKIGRRGIYMPPQFLNTAILPIIKESQDKISVLLFCSDNFNKERLKKAIWLLLRLTSGLANEYIVYFPDYNASDQNSVNEVLRSYNNNDLTTRIQVDRISFVNSKDLQIIPADHKEHLVDIDFEGPISKKLKVQPHLIDYLPYGDSIRPFLASEAVKSVDLKAFLSQKGIFLKSADKAKMIQLMTSMLFSPMDIDSLVEYVNINERPLSTSSKQYPLLDENFTSEKIEFKVNDVSPYGLQENLKAEVVATELIHNKNGSVTIKSYIEQKNPNKQALVSISRSISQVTIGINKENKKIEFIKEYNSKPAKTLSDRLVNMISGKLISDNIIEDRVAEILFSSFSNSERVNFLLSFTNIDTSNILIDFDAKSIKFMFDESLPLPKEYVDKQGKECVTQLKGRNLDSIKEFQDETLKSILLCEEFSINYKFKIRNVLGNYFVVMNFSDALNNKPIPEGIFSYNGRCYLNSRNKEKVGNILTLEKELKIEFNRLVKEKLKSVNKI